VWGGGEGGEEEEKEGRGQKGERVRETSISRKPS
jgi:hypothetical protein